MYRDNRCGISTAYTHTHKYTHILDKRAQVQTSVEATMKPAENFLPEAGVDEYS